MEQSEIGRIRERIATNPPEFKPISEVMRDWYEYRRYVSDFHDNGAWLQEDIPIYAMEKPFKDMFGYDIIFRNHP